MKYTLEEVSSINGLQASVVHGGSLEYDLDKAVEVWLGAILTQKYYNSWFNELI